MRNLIVTAVLALSFAMPVGAAEGMINVQSDFGVKETANRLENILKKKGMTVFGRIEHSVGAEKVGVELRDTELLIFGNPKVGSPLMKCQQTVAIDLPQKALVWEDEKARVWISYNDPEYLQARHSMAGCDAVLEKIKAALGGMTKAAATQ